MTNYNIKNTSPWMSVLTAVVVVFSSMGVLYFLKTNYFPSLSGLIVGPLSLGLAFYSLRFTAIVRMEVQIGDQGLKISWLKQFLFHKYPDYDIHWADIKEYLFIEDRNYDVFKLTLRDGSKIKINHYNLFNKDDYKNFQYDFIAKITHLNVSDEFQENPIVRGKTMYETKAAIIVSYLLIVIMIAIPLFIIVCQLDWSKPSLLASLGSLYTASFYFLALVDRHKKTKID